jgi:hypothetical protein
VGFDEADDDVAAFLALEPRRLEHRVRLPDAGRRSEEDRELPPASPSFLATHVREEDVGIRTITHEPVHSTNPARGRPLDAEPQLLPTLTARPQCPEAQASEHGAEDELRRVCARRGDADQETDGASDEQNHREAPLLERGSALVGFGAVRRCIELAVRMRGHIEIGSKMGIKIS